MVKDRRSRGKPKAEPMEQEEAPIVNGKEHVNGKQQVNGETPSKANDERPLGKRELGIKSPSTVKRQNSTSGSQCVLLTQGIMANDEAKISSVLQGSNIDVINATIRELQPMQVLPLLKIVENRLRTKGANDVRPIIRWAQITFSVHMPYLCSLPNLEKEIGGLLGWLRSRVNHQKELLGLHGKISTIADQIKRRTNKVVIVQQPLVVFNNDLDSESEDFENIGSDGEDAESSDDDWWDDNELKEDGEEDGEEDDDNENDNDEDSDDESDHNMDGGSDSGSGDDDDDGGEEESDGEEDMEVG